MSVQIRDIKRRITGTRHIGKVTSALQQVASARLAKERKKVDALSRYTEEITVLLQGIVTSGINLEHPLLRQSRGTGTCLILMGSDRGLCGGYNSEIIRKLEEYLDISKKDDLNLITIGSIATRRAAKLGLNISYSCHVPSPDTYEEFLDIIIRKISSGFLHDDFANVKILYTHFVSPLNKNPVIVDLLPMSSIRLTNAGTSAGPRNNSPFFNAAIFDPSATGIIDLIIPEVLRQMLDYTQLHSVCSEDSYRQQAMSRASDNSRKMMHDLMLTYSRLRQEDITTEMLEIAASGFAGAKSGK